MLFFIYDKYAMKIMILPSVIFNFIRLALKLHIDLLLSAYTNYLTILLLI